MSETIHSYASDELLREVDDLLNRQKTAADNAAASGNSNFYGRPAGRNIQNIERTALFNERFGAYGDDTAAQAAVAPVEDGGLARCDGPDGLSQA